MIAGSGGMDDVDLESIRPLNKLLIFDNLFLFLIIIPAGFTGHAPEVRRRLHRRGREEADRDHRGASHDGLRAEGCGQGVREGRVAVHAGRGRAAAGGGIYWRWSAGWPAPLRKLLPVAVYPRQAGGFGLATTSVKRCEGITPDHARCN